MVKKDAKETGKPVPEQPASPPGDGSGQPEDDLEKMDRDYLLLRLRDKEKEAAEHYDKYVRSVAELDNYKKRAAKERTDAIMYGQERLLKDLLPLVDSLERAMGQECTVENIAAFRQGLNLIHDQLLSHLERHGVKPLSAVGEQFDPNVHEAMLQVEADEQGENKVIDEYEKGYLLHGRLLRPARVSVGKRRKNDTHSNPTKEGE
jgi:molecular chaperone GrpE